MDPTEASRQSAAGKPPVPRPRILSFQTETSAETSESLPPTAAPAANGGSDHAPATKPAPLPSSRLPAPTARADVPDPRLRSPGTATEMSSPTEAPDYDTRAAIREDERAKAETLAVVRATLIRRRSVSESRMEGDAGSVTSSKSMDGGDSYSAMPIGGAAAGSAGAAASVADGSPVGMPWVDSTTDVTNLSTSVANALAGKRPAIAPEPQRTTPSGPPIEAVVISPTSSSDVTSPPEGGASSPISVASPPMMHQRLAAMAAPPAAGAGGAAAGSTLFTSMAPTSVVTSMGADVLRSVSAPTSAAAPVVAAVSGVKAAVQEMDVTSEAAFQRVSITGPVILSAEQRQACVLLKRAIELREKYVFHKPTHYWGPYAPTEFPFSPRLSGMSMPAAGGTPSRTGSAPAELETEGDAGSFNFDLTGSSGDLVTATTTGLVAAPQAAPLVAQGLLHGSQLVTLETGKDYGNLFYRRRLEPPFTAFNVPTAPADDLSFRFVNGVVRVYRAPADEATGMAPSVTTGDTVSAPTPSVDFIHTGDEPDTPVSEAEEDATVTCLFSVPSFMEYRKDYLELVRIVHTPAVKTFAYRRLELLSARFQLHMQLNADKEMAESKAVPHRDFYNVRKVDTHVHHSACMNQKHLLNFIKAKLKNEPDSVTIMRDGKQLTLREVFESLNLTAYDLSVDTLDMHADWTTFHRFDRFNLKYNPVGQSRLREIFLKTDNFIKGRYLAEITREVMNELEATKYSLAEWRLSIYGKSRDEWSRLAAWVVDNKLASPQVRWMIQIPRLYDTYRETKSIRNFQDMLDNIFLPLFAVTHDPSSDPKLHQFLGLVVGFDSVDDESKQEHLRDSSDMPLPDGWSSAFQPPYYYWNYFLAANLTVLNKYRQSRGMTQFSFRPHSGEAGDVDHLAATFLTSESVNHGINLRKSPALQYLYYLTQIGLAVSPLSNNKLFVEYNKNPFYEFFTKGMNVSLSTDDPLLLSYTREPLIEEYCVAAQVWKLTAVDLCEIARNSVLQSGFEHPYKAHFIGSHYGRPGPEGNDIHSTNVPFIRLQYRKETLDAEHAVLEVGANPDATAAASPSSRPVVRYCNPTRVMTASGSSLSAAGDSTSSLGIFPPRAQATQANIHTHVAALLAAQSTAQTTASTEEA